MIKVREKERELEWEKRRRLEKRKNLKTNEIRGQK